MAGESNRRRSQVKTADPGRAAGRGTSSKQSPGADGPQPALTPGFAAALRIGPGVGNAPIVPDLPFLQQTVGNRVTARSLPGVVHRVPIRGDALGETLYNQPGTGGKAGAQKYSITANYDITRDGDAGAAVKVKILFMSQSRNTTPPPPGAPAGTPRLGQLIGEATEIATGDERREWGEKIAQDAVKHWNGMLVLVGEEINVFRANDSKRLPVTFSAEAVWKKSEDHHAVVTLHPSAVTGGATGHPIDAGNFYMKKDDKKYPESDEIIYAHEYGHLLGIPDEYSQSNEQMNALLHEAAPKSAPSSMAALDKKTVERMALAALTRPLYAQMGAAMPGITDALRSGRKQVKARMTSAAREAVRSPLIRDTLRAQLAAGSEAKLAPHIPTVVAFQTAKNFSAKTRASEGVDAGFAATALQKQIQGSYWKALLAPHDEAVDVKGLGSTTINVSNAVYGAAGTGTAEAAPAAGVSAGSVGPASPAPGGLPDVPPPASLLAKIQALPASWAAAGSELESLVTPDAFAAKMKSILDSAGLAEVVASIVASLTPGVAAPPAVSTARQLYAKARDIVANASREAAQQVATDVITATVDPLLTENVTSMQADIAAEVTRVMTTPPAGMARAASPDPNMTAIVNAMKARLDADKAATKDTGRHPLAAEGSTAPDQDVTYSYQGLMGSNKSTAVRADQFARLVGHFNKHLKTLFEKPFKAEVKK